MRRRRNADEGSRRRQRAQATDPHLLHHVVADKLRTGRAHEITLGELAQIQDRGMLQAIPDPLWSALGAALGMSGEAEIPVQLGPVKATLEVQTNDQEYPSVFVKVPSHQANPNNILAALEFAQVDGGPLQLLVFGNPFDPEGAPTHYLRFIPYSKALERRWERSSYVFPTEAEEALWDAEDVLGNP